MRITIRALTCLLVFLFLYSGPSVWAGKADRQKLAATVAGDLQRGYSLDAGELAQLQSFTRDDKEFLRLADDYGRLRGAGFDHGEAITALSQMRAARDDEKQRAAARDFMGYQWGLGFGISADLDEGDRIDSAEIVNGIVRVTKQSNLLPRIVLEGHHFVIHNGKEPDSDVKDKEKATRGQGPFIAVQSSGDDVISGFGVGWMVGFRYKNTSPNSFNLSLGAIVDANVQTLGDGFEANQPPPNGETEIRYKEGSRVSLLFFASFSF